ncbi:MAG: hypothetical protein IJC73_02165, partial [Lentisphaeria bacterium]|nr:hypothetical protein [Lentisphaeria bacterium]
MEKNILTWQDTPEMAVVRRIAGRLAGAGGRALLVGGCVRDRLLGATAHDFDLEVFGLPPEAVAAALLPEFEVDSVGAAFGVFKV